MTRKKILVTGGAGYIGSHTIIDLIEQGFDVVSVDNLSRSSLKTYERISSLVNIDIPHYEIDLCNLEATELIFHQHPDIQGIIHFAAFKSVGESVAFPLRYYHNNIASLVNILLCIERFQIPYFVFSSSCSVYGNLSTLPVTETTPFSAPESPYAASKQMGEQIVSDFSKRVNVKSIMLRYFNPVGAHSSGKLGEVPFDKPNNLVPIITQTAIGKLPGMYIWGSDYPTRDGTCIRDYIHVMDIARAHTQALHYSMQRVEDSCCEIFNLGSGHGISVLEAIHAFESVSGVKLRYEFGPRRKGDVVSIYADNSRSKDILHWEPQLDIEEMMRSAWEWEKRI